MTVTRQAESMFERVQRERKLLYDAFDKLERGEPVDFELLRGVLGVVQEEEPITWQQLQAALALGTDEAMGVLGRTVRQIQQYYRQRDNVDARKVALLPPDFDAELRIVWRDNDFPYYFVAGIEHHNVWANRPLSTQQLEQVIAENRVGYGTCYYINPPALQSVPTGAHEQQQER
ncbi:hypothetical protein N2152v2_010238 [Parachlorella kessleri]